MKKLEKMRDREFTFGKNNEDVAQILIDLMSAQCDLVEAVEELQEIVGPLVNARGDSLPEGVFVDRLSERRYTVAELREKRNEFKDSLGVYAQFSAKQFLDWLEREG